MYSTQLACEIGRPVGSLELAVVTGQCTLQCPEMSCRGRRHGGRL